MLHNELFDVFKLIMKTPDEKIDAWFPNGRNSVRVRFTNGIEVILKYEGPSKWKLETMDYHLDQVIRGLVDL